MIQKSLQLLSKDLHWFFFLVLLFCPFSSVSLKEEKAKQILHGVHLVEGKEGEKVWELWSDKIQGFKNGKDWVLQNLSLHFFSENDMQFVLKGKKGFIENFDGNKRNLLVEQQVKITSNSGHQFETEKIKYLSEPKMLQSLGEVKMKGAYKKQDFYMKAKRMEIFLKKNVAQLKENVFGFYSLAFPIWGDKHFQVQSQLLTLNYENSEMKFEKEVILHIGKRKVKTSKAFLKYHPETHKVDSLLLLGGVVVKEGSKTIQAKSLEWDTGKDELTFHGPAQIIEEENKFRARTIIVTEQGTRVRMIEAQVQFWVENLKLNLKKNEFSR